MPMIGIPASCPVRMTGESCILEGDLKTLQGCLLQRIIYSIARLRA